MRRRDIDTIAAHLIDEGWFTQHGVYALVDGQFGSTGKGVAASFLEHAVAQTRYRNDYWGMSNAGPNSGHTAIFNGHRMVTQQLPISSMQTAFSRGTGRAYLNAGAIIDPHKLMEEWAEFNKFGKSKLVVHPLAAIIQPEDGVAEAYDLKTIASTGKGVGAALSSKVMRQSNVVKNSSEGFSTKGIEIAALPSMYDNTVIMEVAQGFSLGLNQRFYPHCTSRECTVTQALSDANIHPHYLRKTLMCVRTYPIRVGNTAEGHSGGWYPDQREVTWEEIGQTPELTTVTKRVRRVATWSNIQFCDAVAANRPDAIFLNFANYMSPKDLNSLIHDIRKGYKQEMGYPLETLIVGWGAETEQCTLWT